MVPGDTIVDHFYTKYMGDTYSLNDKLDNHHYIILYLKYIDYTMKIMSTYFGLTEYPNYKVYMHSFTNITGEGKTEKLKYKIPFKNNFK